VATDGLASGSRLRAYRDWYALEQTEVAGRLADLGEQATGRRPGVTNEMVSRWERNVSRPSAYYRRLLRKLYEVGDAHLGFRPPLPGEIVIHPWDRLEETHPAAASWTMGGTARALRAAVEGAAMDRRAFLAAAGLGATGISRDWLLAPGLTSAASTSGRALPPETVDQLETITGQLRRMDDQLGGGDLHPVIRQHLIFTVSLISDRRYHDPTGRRLHTIAAELARLAGWASFDAGRHGAAQRYYAAALHAAHTAGDRALGANVLGFASCQAKDLGQTGDAITLADAAVSGYPGRSPRVAAILHLRLAEAHATAGNQRECRTAIDTAFTRLADPRPGGEPAWSYWINPAQAHAQAGYCHLTLGDQRAAQAHLCAALDLQDPADSREGALRAILLASSYARQPQPDVEQAAAHASSAVTALSGPVASTRCVGHLTRLTASLRPYRRQPAVRDLLDQAAPLLTR